MEDKENLKSKIEEENDDKLKEEEQKLNEDKNSDLSIDKKSKIIIGNIYEAPKFLQGNEYIKNGYVINCPTFKTSLRTLFMLHNETINTWSHLLGAIFFVFLLFYTIYFYNDFNLQLNIIKNDSLPSIEQKAMHLYELSPSKTYQFYESIKNIQKDFHNYKQTKIYNETFNNIFSLYNQVYNYFIKEMLSFLESLLDSLSLLKKDIVDLINLDATKTQKLESFLSNEIIIEMKERPKKALNKLPLYIIIICAFLCLFFSATYHGIKIISEKVYNISHRFDHGGISLLITGSCFPPYFYFFYHEIKYMYFYLIGISIIGIGIFLFSILSSDFSKPYKRTFRGILFILFGICTGIPVIHMTFFGSTIKGYVPGIKLNNWYIGGFSYIIGAIIYVLRFPEKKFQGKFDYFGSSHQIFHILVFLGATFHFFGSLDAYKYRYKNFEL